MKTVDLFAGAGLLTEGFRQAGFQCVFAAEADERAVASFNENLEPVAHVWDVTSIRGGLNAQVLVAGPPCQGFSSLGKRDTHDQRNGLSLLVLDWMKVVDPDIVVIENVPQFLASPYWQKIQRSAKSRGYATCSWTLDASHFGAPQKRVRAFGILSRIGLPECPLPTHSQAVTVRQAFKGLRSSPSEKGLHVAPIPTGIAKERISIIPRKGDRRDIMRLAPNLCPPSWFKLGQQAVDVWGRMDADRPANTLRCAFQNPSKGRYIHPFEDRVITLREGARLQGVPDSWKFHGDRTAIARQIGNGVPIPLGRAVGIAIAKVIGN